MKSLKIMVAIIAICFIGCDKDDILTFSGPPTNVSATFDITQDNSGNVTITPSGDNTRQFLIKFGDGASASVSSGSAITHQYAEGTFTVEIEASNGTSQTATFSQSITISFDPPANLAIGLATDATNPALVSVTPTAANATMFDVYFGEAPNDAVSIMAGETAMYTYGSAGDYTIRVVAKGASAQTIEVTEMVSIAMGTAAIELPVDFQSSATVGYNFFAFGYDGASASIVDNPNPTGINTSVKVGAFNKAAGSEIWAGLGWELGTDLDFANNDRFTVKVHSPKAGITVRLKVENATNGGIFHEQDATIQAANEWEELTFDFSGADAAQSYSKVVLFFDFGVSGDGSDYYFDDIVLSKAESTGGPSDPIALPVDFESTTVNYAFTSFGPDGDHATVVDNPNKSGINTSDKVTQFNKVAGSETWAGTFLQLGSDIDFSTTDQFKVKVHSPKAGITVRMKIENASDGAIFSELDQTVTAADAWEELTFDFSGIDKTQSYRKVVLFFDWDTAGDDSNYYFDDIVLEAAGGSGPSDPVALPIDFESTTVNYAFTSFGPDGDHAAVVDNPDKSGINTSDKVGRFNKVAGSEN